jgi:adenine-specific DNA-methyltransferase
MGNYFDKVTHQRMKKVIYSPSWKSGKPLSRNKGVSHIMKYLRLESYEDALSNIELKKNNGMAGLFGDDYMINYMLDIEAKGSLLKLKAFKTPFSYEMNITEKNESKPQRVDVCETFNYLIGLTVQRQGFIRTYDSTPAAKPEYEGAVDLVKGTQFAFRQIEGTLPDGRKALVIWRTIGEDLKACNAALDAYFEKYRINPHDREYDVIYVNGDNNLENLCTADETWKVVLIEQEFNKRMFEEE